MRNHLLTLFCFSKFQGETGASSSASTAAHWTRRPRRPFHHALAGIIFFVGGCSCSISSTEPSPHVSRARCSTSATSLPAGFPSASAGSARVRAMRNLSAGIPSTLSSTHVPGHSAKPRA
eukprot:scaffold748_cov251-Pinguiococcus_pyrenoidosus.AAC.19